MQVLVNLGSGWHRYGATWAKGYAFKGSVFYAGEALAALLDAAAVGSGWRRILPELNGAFAVVRDGSDRLEAAVDRVRTIPLFYGINGEYFSVSSDANKVRDRLGGGTPSGEAVSEFRLTGYVTGSDTLFPYVKQLQAGEILELCRNERRHRCVRYYVYRHQDFFSASSTTLIDRLDEVHDRVFQRLIDSVGDRPVILPMSGGYDSRLIGVALRKAGLRNVLCYTYGAPGNWESRLSRETAEYLGFEWIFVPYTAERWRNWSQGEGFGQYFRSSGNLTSVPHLQDWPAILELRRENRIPQDSIIVPGHSGDFLAGSHIPQWFGRQRTITRRELLDAIYKRHYHLWDFPGRWTELRERFDARIERIIGAAGSSSIEEAADQFEHWDLQERQAKFICNSLRVYDFFGLEWRVPLFDSELMDFWSHVPVAQRIGRRLFFDFVKRKQDLPITKPNKDRSLAVELVFSALQGAGLWDVAKRIQRVVKKIKWRSEYEGHIHAAFALVDSEWFRESFTGQESIHSYMALCYLGLIGEVQDNARLPSWLLELEPLATPSDDQRARNAVQGNANSGARE